jgi:tetratricopeptide (TPR) repeat protein
VTTPRAAFLASAIDQVRELADPVVAMLDGESQSDPFLIVTTTQLAAFVVRAAEDDLDLDDDEEVPSEARALAEGLIDHARHRGRLRLAEAFDALDLAATCALDLDPEADPFERASRLHDLYELAFLADVLDPNRRARLIDALELATAEVLLDPEAFSDLLLPALELRALVYLPDDHAASILLDAVITATDWLTAPPPATEAEAQAVVAQALAGLDTRLPIATRLREWLRKHVAAVADAFLLTPTPLFAASSASQTWPRPRLVLGRVETATGPLDVSLDTTRDTLFVEAFGPGAASLGTLTIESPPSPPLGPIGFATTPDSRRARVPMPDATTLDALTVVVTTRPPTIDGAATTASPDLATATSETRRFALSEALSEPPHALLMTGHPLADARARERTLALVPGKSIQSIRALAERVAETDLATAADLAAFAAGVARLAVHPARGIAHFVALLVRPRPTSSYATHVGFDLASFFDAGATDLATATLIRVSSDPLAPRTPLSAVGADPASLAHVARWIGTLVGEPDALTVDQLDLGLTLPTALAAELVDLIGDSWQLGAALAVISERLGQVPATPLIASGRLGDRPGEVLPVEGVAEKRRFIEDELDRSDAPFLIDSTRDLRPDLDRLFGPDWSDRLRRALGLDADALARRAARAWAAFWQRRNVLDLGPRRDEAMDLASRALAANVTGAYRVEALWVRGAGHLHRGETDAATRDLDEVDRLLASAAPGTFDAWRSEELAAYRGIALLDRLDPDAAIALLTSALGRLDAVPADASRDRRFHEVRLQLAGSLHRAQVSVGDLDAAYATLMSSIATSPIASERARALGDLAEVERRRGHLDAAATHLAASFEALDDIDFDTLRAFTRRFLVVYAKRLDLAGGLSPIALTRATTFAAPAWDRWPEPLETLEDLLAANTATLTTWFEDHVIARLDTLAPIHLLVVLGTLSRAAELGHPVLGLARTLGTHLGTRTTSPDVAGRLATLDEATLRRLARTTPY